MKITSQMPQVPSNTLILNEKEKRILGKILLTAIRKNNLNDNFRSDRYIHRVKLLMDIVQTIHQVRNRIMTEIARNH